MRKLFVTGVVFLCGATLRADFTYQQTSQMTGGALFQMMSALEVPLAPGPRTNRRDDHRQG